MHMPPLRMAGWTSRVSRSCDADADTMVAAGARAYWHWTSAGVQICTAERPDFCFCWSVAVSFQETTLSKDEPVVVVFFGEHAVRGVVVDVDKAKAVVAFGQGAWTITAPRNWIRQTEDDLVPRRRGFDSLGPG
jgi:hypothetical protein